MERRESNRQTTTLCAVIRYRRLGLLSCRVTDVSIEGMQAVSGVIRIPTDSYVKLYLQLRQAGQWPRTISCGAWVRWWRSEAMGLSFTEPQPQLLALLKASDWNPARHDSAPPQASIDPPDSARRGADRIATALAQLATPPLTVAPPVPLARRCLELGNAVPESAPLRR